MKENTAFIIKLGLILFIIVSVSTLALSVVNFITEDIIIQKNIEMENNARKNVLPEADKFDKVDNLSALDKSVTDVYIAYKDDKINGYCITVSANGYGGDINMIVGVNADLSISGVNIISMSETAGLGANAQKPEFTDQYKGKTSGVKVVKTSSDAINTINAISGATITSNAVTSGVNIAIETAATIKEVA